jgi:hypothetical protein
MSQTLSFASFMLCERIVELGGQRRFRFSLSRETTQNMTAGGLEALGRSVKKIVGPPIIKVK